jgi:hypothetical protein
VTSRLARRLRSDAAVGLPQLHRRRAACRREGGVKKIIAYLKARGFTSASVEETRHHYVKVRPWRNVGGHYIDL